MSKWYSFKELKRARTPMLLDSETGLPDNHVITVVERVISVDDPELIQNNVRTDTFTLNLDAEYDDLNVVVIFTKPNNINVKVAYNGTPTHIPGSAMELVGSLACSVVGIDADGEVRAVTKAAPDTFQVVKSGAYDGSVTSDDAELLGQILQAVSDAEAAITEAETATTAATNATNQATSAATSANQAASSANSAASSANSAATKANSAAVDAQNAYDTLQPYMATIDSCANILHREVGPDIVVTADDSFPCKPVEMVVYGNTVQNLWVNPSGTTLGVTVAANNDGSVTVSGTNDRQSSIYVTGANTHALRDGTTYTASVDKNPVGFKLVAQYYNDDGYVGNVFGFTPTGATKATFTADFGEATRVNFYVQVESGQTVSGTYRVMLNEGSTAEPWCPPGLNSVGDGGSVDIVTAGKNLFDASAGIDTQPEYEQTVNNDGSFDFSISKNGWYSFDRKPLPVIHGAKYTISVNKKVCNYGHGFVLDARDYTGAVVKISNVTNVGGSYDSAPAKTWTCPDDVAQLWVALWVDVEETFPLSVSDVKLCVNIGEDSEWTPYAPTITTPIDLQGHTLNALPDGTRDELHIDGGGNVVLEKRCGDVDKDFDWKLASADNGTVMTGLLDANRSSTTSDELCAQGFKVADSRNTGDWSDYACGVAAPSPGSYQLYVKTVAGNDLATSKQVIVNQNGRFIYKLKEPQTIDLGTITPPTMAAPNVTAYVADDTPAEMELDYVRDINIVVDRLEKKVADLVVTEATIV